MLERTSLLRIALAAVFAASLAAMPLAIKAQEATDPATKSGTAVKGKKTTTPKSKTGDTPPAETKSRQTTPPEPKSTTTETKSGKSLTPGQTAARERQWQERTCPQFTGSAEGNESRGKIH